MTIEVIDVVGIVKWAKVLEDNHDMGSVKGVNNAKYDYPESCNLILYLDQEELLKVTRALPSIKPEVDEDGISVKFNRRWVNRTNSDWGGPVTIKDADSKPWDQSKLIGHGSKLRVIAETFPSSFGKKMRMTGIQVLEHVEPQFEESPELPF